MAERRLLSGRAPEHYSARDGRFAVENGPEAYNRPLYGGIGPDGAHRLRIVAGDRPELALVLGGIGGYLFFAFGAGESFLWAPSAARVAASYGAGEMSYEFEDPRLGPVATLSVLPLAEGPGLALRVACGAPGRPSAFRLLFGGMSGQADARAFDAGYRGPEALAFSEERCAADEPSLLPWGFATISAPAGLLAAGRGEGGWRCRLVDAGGAGAGPEPVSADEGRPSLVEAGVELEGEARCFALALAGAPAGAAAGTAPAACRVAAEWTLEDPAGLYERAREAAAATAGTAACETPDPLLDAALGAACTALDGAWVGGTYRHGAWSWDLPLLGWRNRYGPSALGWGDRVRADAELFMSLQRGGPARDGGPGGGPAPAGAWAGYFTSADLAPATGAPLGRPDPDPAFRWARQSPRSLVAGEGMIPYMPGRDGVVIYNMQEVFFDQAIRELEWSGDRAFADRLAGALRLHLDWERRCFDADGDGLYENFANYWASDGVFASGAGCAIATAYNYRAARAMAELEAGRGRDPGPWELLAGRIRGAFRERLWMREEGHPAEMADSYGARSIRPSMSLPTAAHCAESGILDGFELYQTVRAVETELEAVEVEWGRLVWNTNWVPYRWSVRDVDYADVFHAALAAYQAGLPGAGWAWLRGALGESTCGSVSPGAFMCVREGRSVDFADSSSMFARALVEGLFGVRPSAREILVAPAFPEEWPAARLRAGRFALSYEAEGARERLAFETGRRIAVRFRLPVRASGEPAALLDGEPVALEKVEGIGRAYVEAVARGPGRRTLEIEWRGPPAAYRRTELRARSGERFALRPEGRAYEEIGDPQGALADATLDGGGLSASLRPGRGRRTFFAKAREGAFAYWEPVEAEPVPEGASPAPPRAAGRMVPVDLSAFFNERLAEIFRREYRSPRSPFCSLQVPLNLYPPNWSVVDDSAAAFLDDSGLSEASVGGIAEACGVPFAAPPKGASRNALFVSLWDLHPREAEIPLLPAGGPALRAVHVLLGGYTHQMLCGVLHGRLELLFGDGSGRGLDLVAPYNFRSLLDGPDTERPEDARCYGPDPPPAVPIGRMRGGAGGAEREQLLWARLLSLEAAGPGPVRLRLAAAANDAILGLLALTLEVEG